jgi:hypothetical protein
MAVSYSFMKLEMISLSCLLAALPIMKFLMKVSFFWFYSTIILIFCSSVPTFFSQLSSRCL